MQDHAAYFQGRSGDIVKKGYLDEQSARFYQALFEYQRDEHARYAALADLPAVRVEDLPLSKNSGIILAEASLSAVAAGAGALSSLIAKHHPGLMLEPLADPIANDTTALKELTGAFLAGDHDMISVLALRYKTGTEECVFVLANLLRPFMAALRERSGAAVPETELQRLCPFCGYYPDMSVIGGGEEGGRFLHCALCENRWQYKRVACTVCGTEDASKLEYLSSEDDRRYRIDVCDECGGYIKTIRLEKLQEPEACDPVVENILTARLDSAAIKKGYRRP